MHLIGIKEAKQIVQDGIMHKKKLDQIVGGPMDDYYFVQGVLEKVKTEVSSMERYSQPREKIYDQINLYYELLTIVEECMCLAFYDNDKIDTLTIGIDKLEQLRDKYDPDKEDKKTQKTSLLKFLQAHGQKTVAKHGAGFQNFKPTYMKDFHQHVLDKLKKQGAAP